AVSGPKPDPYSSTKAGDVVQLVRTLPCHGRGRGFESRRPRQLFQSLTSWHFWNLGASRVQPLRGFPRRQQMHLLECPASADSPDNGVENTADGCACYSHHKILSEYRVRHYPELRLCRPLFHSQRD